MGALPGLLRRVVGQAHECKRILHPGRPGTLYGGDPALSTHLEPARICQAEYLAVGDPRLAPGLEARP
jgi:hypothetical protein